jgi:hypothetical protein
MKQFLVLPKGAFWFTNKWERYRGRWPWSKYYIPIAVAANLKEELLRDIRVRHIDRRNAIHISEVSCSSLKKFHRTPCLCIGNTKVKWHLPYSGECE